MATKQKARPVQASALPPLPAGQQRPDPVVAAVQAPALPPVTEPVDPIDAPYAWIVAALQAKGEAELAEAVRHLIVDRRAAIESGRWHEARRAQVEQGLHQARLALGATPIPQG